MDLKAKNVGDADNYSGIKVSYSYYIEINHGLPEEPEITSTKDAKPKPTEDSKPSLTQDSLIDTYTSFYQAAKGDTCTKIIAKYKTFDFNDFFKWNPAVEEDYSGLWANTYYYVGIPRTPTSPPSQTTATETAVETGPSKPSPTQEGLIESYTSFYFATKGDTCAKIVAKYGTFDFNDFYKWNPAVGKDCGAIWASTYYYVGVPGTPTTKPAPTTPKPTATSGIETPSPIQENMVQNCNKFHKIMSTTTCSSIESYYKLPLATFLSWNPSVGKDCSALWVNYYVCVSVEGYQPSTTTAKPTTTKAPTNGIETPSPIQDGMVKNCNKFHKIMSTTTCSSIESALLVNYYVCVSVEGWKPSTTTAKPTTTQAPANGIQTPSPIQNGMVKNYEKFHKIMSTTTCTSIESYYNLPLATFLSWNPAVGKDCTSLLVDYYVCIATISWKPPTKTTTKAPTTTKGPSNGISTPSPIQAGMVSNYNKFHLVNSTTTCTSIQNYYKITMADFAKWNPTIGSKYTALWANYHVCIGIIGGTPTNPGNSISTPSPIQPGIVSNYKKFHLVSSTTTCASIQDYYKITMAQFAKWNPAVGEKCTALWA
ncbi:Hypothetical protein NCS54_01196400 [Fusarium falciforme]|uniref:Hypothetical protein n=1 Tax=Fusarium falciforme TaxID=195108 RepID=UPI00230164A4|nr:Hypothetical protein NCS54_01196400 [Fusarium falciforme]WAO94383.1 Hypothetical protein NCS54_01196400 [Fusarium falciforme]